MATTKWTLSNSTTDHAPNTVTEAANGAISIRTLRGGKREGVDVVEIDNGAMKFALLPTRGMGVWKGWHGRTEIGWQSPVRGPVHPSFVPLMEPGGLGWLDGFDELLVRCGLESNGAPDFDENGRLAYPLHGRVANLPAHFVEASRDDQSGELSVTGIVDETRFHFQKLRLTSTFRTAAGEQGFRIRDVVKNFGGGPATIQLLYHVNFGAPLCVPGSKSIVPVKEMCPRDARAAECLSAWETYGEPEPGSAEQVYFFTLLPDEKGDTRVLLATGDELLGVSLKFNTSQLPCYTIWKNNPPVEDGYVTGLEPGTNFPNPRPHETAQGRVVEIAPGASVAFDLALQFHPDSASVSEAKNQIAALQKQAEPISHDTPQPGWTA